MHCAEVHTTFPHAFRDYPVVGLNRLRKLCVQLRWKVHLGSVAEQQTVNFSTRINEVLAYRAAVTLGRHRGIRGRSRRRAWRKRLRHR